MPEANILLVEDDETLRELTKRNLCARDYQVSTAEDVHTALEHLRSRNFDLIVLDINLPDQTGWDVLRVARHEGYIRPLKDGNLNNTLPVVILSAVRVSPNRLAEFHPLAYLPKPFPMEALLRLAAEAALYKQEKAGSIYPDMHRAL
ncbi:response regulator [Ktedonosporobacter rubrisoli]|uniref:Response regulator n=1 Tax=Ktedonosporobacter rubrisoli TaxID=2509675 RepID=A0A4P6JSL0_KTERU|nr:response regulator [Ktedonosporobacter rubrisoli]QBD77856.1 response regulator [Ktedonosporobacter rubrisoli]